jgi:hypothetical protein
MVLECRGGAVLLTGSLCTVYNSGTIIHESNRHQDVLVVVDPEQAEAFLLFPMYHCIGTGAKTRDLNPSAVRKCFCVGWTQTRVADEH